VNHLNADLWVLLPAAAVALAVLARAFLSGLEAALLNSRRSRLPLVSGDQRARLETAEQLLDAPESFTTAAHVMAAICEAITYSAAACLGVALAAPRGRDVAPEALLRHAVPAMLLALSLAVLVMLLLGESLPRTLAARDPELMLVRNGQFMRLYSMALAPVLYFVGGGARMVARILRVHPRSHARPARTEEEIKSIVGGSAEEGVIDAEEKEMIHSIFDFTETSARQIMVPRVDIYGVPDTATLEEAAAIILAQGYSRIPVYQGTLDQVIGILYAKDLIKALLEDKRDQPVRDLAREPFFVSENKKLDGLLADFRQHRTQMAIVVDEFGGTSGLVTLEDVLEEIVGEIQDEFDAEEPSIARVDPQTSVVDAHLPIDEVNEQLGLDLPLGDYDTLGGFVYDLFGRPPEVGEQVAFERVQFIVEETDGPRLLKVRIVRPPPEHPGGEAPSEPGN
jgi:putative hemolysin